MVGHVVHALVSCSRWRNICDIHVCFDAAMHACYPVHTESSPAASAPGAAEDDGAGAVLSSEEVEKEECTAAPAAAEEEAGTQAVAEAGALLAGKEGRGSPGKEQHPAAEAKQRPRRERGAATRFGHDANDHQSDAERRRMAAAMPTADADDKTRGKGRAVEVDLTSGTGAKGERAGRKQGARCVEPKPSPRAARRTPKPDAESPAAQDKRRRTSEAEQVEVGSPPPPGWAERVPVLVEKGPANSPEGRSSGGSAVATPVRLTGSVARPFAGILPEGYQALPCPPAGQMVARSEEAKQLVGVEYLVWGGRVAGWRKGVINAACRAKSNKTINGEPVSHVGQYEAADDEIIKTDLVLKAETYATSEQGAPEAWLLIEKASVRTPCPF